MPMLYDKAKISGGAMRITPEGYLVADALVGQANNIQEYRAYELGLTDRAPNDVVRVYRPESEVFAAESLRSASRLPITLDHPVKDGKPVMVDAKNYTEFARGETGEEILRDGQFMRVPLRVTDSGAVASVQAERQEFSLGYSCEVQFVPGVTDAGQPYDATATTIRYNHLAACRTARGGPQLRIVDERPVPKGVTSMIVLVDGMPIDAANVVVAEPAIRNLVAARDTALSSLTEATNTIGVRDATIAAKDAEIQMLKDQLAAAVPTPQALRDAAASYARTVDQAKRLGATVTDAMDEPAVMAATVRHRMGDKAASYTPEQHAAAFSAMVDTLPADNGGHRPVVDSLAPVIGNIATIGDAAAQAATAKGKRYERYANAHMGKSAAAAA